MSYKQYVRHTPSELNVVIEARVEHKLIERKWLDTISANIAVTLIRLQGGDVGISDMLCYNYSEDSVEVIPNSNDETVSIFKQWVSVTGG